MNIFITGITGTLGTEITKAHHDNGDNVWGISRSESKIVEWKRKHGPIATVYTCDVCELCDESKEVTEKLVHSDRVYHLAALKHVTICENQPDEALLQNVQRTGIIAYICQTVGIPLIFASSDKACGGGGMGVYGATKLLGEKEVLRRDGAVVRLGNLIGSSGSVFSIWSEAVKRGDPIQVTDPLMTRYFIPVEQAARFMMDCCIEGKIVAPRMKSIVMGKVASRIAGYEAQLYIQNTGTYRHIQIVGARPGETRHQYLFPPDSRLLLDPNRYTLDTCGEMFPNGLCSKSAEQWDVEELLEVAGVNP